MSTRKPRTAKTASDGQRIIREGVRRILAERADEWRPLWIRRDAAGAWRVEREYGGAPELTIDVKALPAKARPVVQALIELLREQAWCARLAGVLAQADLASATGRELTRKVIASNRKAEAAAREATNKARCLELAADGFNDSAIARIMAKEKRGGGESLRKKAARWRDSTAT